MLPRIGPITMTAPPKMHQVCMAPSRTESSVASVGSPSKAPLPLSRRLIRQIQQHVASSGRSLQRLEICGRIIDNFDDLDDLVDDSASDQETDGSTAGNAIEFVTTAEEDDDLTNLTWLQDRNLLRGINLSKSDAEDTRPSPVPVISQSTETRSLPPSPTSECGSEATESNSPPISVAAPYDPQTHAYAKPPYSFSCLIFMAIEASSARALPVKEIYAWIVRHFPYFKEAPQGWKNSVRHNLSLNKCFHKVDKRPSLGKGSLWTVDPRHRGGLIQAFGRSPIPPAVSRAPPACAPETPTPTPPRKGAPDPQLFPFLAKRLAGGSEGDENGDTQQTVTSMDDYLAAATVLAMKYGPSVMMRLPPAPECNSAGVVISSSPSEDHTYLGGGGGLAGVPRDERRTAEALLNLAGVTSEDIQLQHHQYQQQHHNLHGSSVALSPPHSFDSAEEVTPHRPRLLRRPGKRRGPLELAAPKRRAPAYLQGAGALDQQAPAYR